MDIVQSATFSGSLATEAKATYLHYITAGIIKIIFEIVILLVVDLREARPAERALYITHSREKIVHFPSDENIPIRIQGLVPLSKKI